MIGKSLDLMIEELEDHTEAAAICHLSVVTFSGEAQTHHPLRKLKEISRLGPLPKGTWTNYVDVWQHLDTTVRHDIAALKGAGHVLKQPAVFFLTDGMPGSSSSGATPVEDWKPYHDRLCDRQFVERPIIVALGLGSVNNETLRHVRSLDPIGVACVAEPGEPASTLLAAALNQILISIVSSVSEGKFVFEVPVGWRCVDDEK
ncbi:hypothetical protein B1H26_41360 [Amycolatopsis sp. BJA-103]|nr:hypothetical protein B1H26_41360 [Amycolatopsis sp. BJA-103]